MNNIDQQVGNIVDLEMKQEAIKYKLAQAKADLLKTLVEKQMYDCFTINMRRVTSFIHDGHDGRVSKK